jgi:hypothetical protein
MSTVRDVMVTDFRKETMSGGGGLAAGAMGTELFVVTDPDGKVLALMAPGQTGPVPVVPIVEEDADLDETVRALTPVLLERQDLAGAVVVRSGEIRGILLRSLIARHAGNLLSVRSFGLPGVPQIPPPIYACPRGDYQEEVDYYDPFHPPRCPVHGERLVRTA